MPSPPACQTLVDAVAAQMGFARSAMAGLTASSRMRAGATDAVAATLTFTGGH